MKSGPTFKKLPVRTTSGNEMPDTCIAYVSGSLLPEAEQRLSEGYQTVDIDGLACARALVTYSGVGADANLIARMPLLELIAVNGVGMDNVDLDAARARGIAVTGTPDVLTDDVADLALALMLAVLRKLPAADHFVRDGAWARGEQFPLARRASGRKAGIIGLGRIGRAIARRIEPMMSEILYHNRRPIDTVAWRFLPDVESLAREVDILFVAAPATSETHEIVDAAVLDALGPDGVLINIARGSLVDQNALVDALREGRLGFAGLDVFTDEPHVPRELLTSDRVVLQPHLGSATIETRSAMNALVLDNLAAHFRGAPLLTPMT